EGCGQWFQMLGLPLVVYDMTGSATQTGLITAARGGIVLLAAPLGGILSDRFSRRTLIVVVSAIAAVQAAALAVLMVSAQAELWHLYIFALVEGAANGINQPARTSFVRDVVDAPDLPNAIALNSIVQNAARVTGPPLAGAMYGFLGKEAVFFSLAALKLLSMGVTLLISHQTRQVVSRTQESALESLWGGFRYSYENKMVLALLIVHIIPPLLIFPYFAMLPFFVYDVLGSDAQGMGWIASALGWGSLVGLAWMTFAGDLRRKGLVMFVGLLVYTLLIVGFARSESFALSMTLLIVAGVFFAPAMALVQTLLLLKTRADMTGRVQALNGMSQGVAPLSNIPMGILVDVWGAPNAVTLFVSLAVVAIVVVAILAPSLRRA
ncbi:MAG: MFS transporter, partial [Dehalococcoidia bacterium]|nr:MFS transporter [Dehalococcoidia bacterium]